MSEAIRETFTFGWELEFLLTDARTYRPLWHTDLEFERLNEMMESIPLDGIPPLDGLELEKPHKKLMPYVVEGYHLPNMDGQARELLPKGLELRTPVCSSLEECAQSAALLGKRLADTALQQGYRLTAMSHHPIATRFEGPQNKRRHDFWIWAKQAMTTYGPDVNVALPTEVEKAVDLNSLNEKLNFYGPVMAALSLASPFWEGELWRHRDGFGRSMRTYRRSVVAPAIETHPEERGRLEYKLMEMSPHLEDYVAHTLLFLTLVLSDRLRGRGSDADRIYDLGEVARFGLEPDWVRRRLSGLLEEGMRVLPLYGLSAEGLEPLVRRWESKLTPADEIIRYVCAGGTLQKVLEQREMNWELPGLRLGASNLRASGLTSLSAGAVQKFPEQGSQLFSIRG
jgi:hypothetical protein